MIVSFSGEKTIRDRIQGYGYSPVLEILSQMTVRALIMVLYPSFINSAGMLSSPADFPSFSNSTAASTSSRTMGEFVASYWGDV